MATAPVKSQQPLHNFSLSGFLSWGGGSSATSHHHQRHRRPFASSADSPPPTDDSDLESRPPRVGSRSSRSPNHHHHPYVASEQPHPPPPPTAPAAERENQIQENGGVASGRDHADGDNSKVEEADVATRRPWNLRPRKAVVNASLRNGESFNEAAFGAVQLQKESCVQQQLKSVRLRGFAEGGGGGEEKEKKKKSKLWISLSKEEIEEDIFVMTGSRPSRRPKKRPRNEQKMIDVR